MRKFVDLHVSPVQEELSRAEDMVKYASYLGFTVLGISNPSLEAYVNWGKKYGVETVSRVNLNPATPEELLRGLRNLRGKCGVVAVTCRTKPVARQAAKDRGVDVLNFPPLGYRHLLDEAEAELASDSNVALEVNTADVLKVEKTLLPKAFHELQQGMTVAKKHDVAVVVSSGASTVYELRAPRDLASFIQMFGLSKQQSLDSVSRKPLEIIERNKKKSSPPPVGFAVRVVKEVTS